VSAPVIQRHGPKIEDSKPEEGEGNTGQPGQGALIFQTLDAAKQQGWSIEQAGVLQPPWLGPARSMESNGHGAIDRRGRHVDIATLKKAFHRG